MKVEIVEKAENPLLKRTEVKFKVDHAGGPTPKRLEVRAQLASLLGVPEELLVIDKLASVHGHQAASGIALAYGSREQLEQREPKYLLERGLPKKPEEKPAEEKPKVKPEKPEPKKEKAQPKEAKLEEKEVKEKPEEGAEGGEAS